MPRADLPQNDDYTVGWVCALPIELTAAQRMLDEVHEETYRSDHDTNIYTLGRIQEHNVVITCLPYGQMGTNSAAIVATQMKSSFPSIEFGLMVGIGGGVPSKARDIRLGDVVVSRPGLSHGGVIQYDFGKKTESGFHRTGFLNMPPTILLNAIAKLDAENIQQRTSFIEDINKLDTWQEFSREAAEPDRLFDARYNHVGDDTCRSCNEREIIKRKPRDQKVLVHYGTIASGNLVMKNAIERDKVSSDLGGVLCFEMEAAGLMNTLPCLVIRGICDYADSHKNKQWQPYAAGTAAVYAKQVLSMVPVAPHSRVANKTLLLKENVSSQSSFHIDPRIQKAVEKLNSHRTAHLMPGIFRMNREALSEHELQSFVHTRGFQSWFDTPSWVLVAKTSRHWNWRDTHGQHSDGLERDQISSETRSSEAPTCPIAACLAEYVQRNTDCDVYYVDCYWILDRPQQLKSKQFENVLKQEQIMESPDTSQVTSILQSLFFQIFARHPQQAQFLQELNESGAFKEMDIYKLSFAEISVLINYILNLPTYLSRKRLIISIDHLELIETSAQRLLINSLNTPRSRLMGNVSMVLGGFSMDRSEVMDFCLGIADDCEYRECLSSLRFEEIDARRTQVPPAAAETNSWIWQHSVYREFSRQDSGILWLRGKPGSGKSVLAKSVRKRLFEQLETQKAQETIPLVGDWFYHRRRAGRYIQHESFLRSILCHFLQQCPEIFHHYVHAYRQMNPLKVVWTNEVLENILFDVCRGSKPIICIVDAVDEAENMGILALIKKLTYPAASSRAKFIVLSRHVVKIEQQIFGLPSITIEDENQDDIAKIIDFGLKSLREEIHKLNFNSQETDSASRIRNVPRHASRMRQPRYKSIALAMEREEQTIEEMRTSLASKAQGSILWVKLVLDKLMREAALDQNCTLEELSQSASDVPQELKEYYQQIVVEMTTQKTEEKITEIRKTLMWICAAGEISDITLEGLWEAVAVLKDNFCSSTMDGISAKRIPISSYDELWRKIYSTCGPFIEAYNPGFSAEESRSYQYGASSIVQLMHQTVRDFLCDESSLGSLSFSIDEARSLVNRHLQNYLKITTKPLRDSCDPLDARELVEELDNQKLLQLAINSTKTHIRTDSTMPVGVKIPHLISPLASSLQHDLMKTLKRSAYIFEDATCDSQDTGRVDAFSKFPNWETHALLCVSRLFYIACSQGFVTAVLNMLALAWHILPDSSLVNGEVILYGVFLAASRCRSSKLHLDFHSIATTARQNASLDPVVVAGISKSSMELPPMITDPTTYPMTHSSNNDLLPQPPISLDPRLPGLGPFSPEFMQNSTDPIVEDSTLPQFALPSLERMSENVELVSKSNSRKRRRRDWKACSRCRVRKIRCTQPKDTPRIKCDHCKKLGAKCSFEEEAISEASSDEDLKQALGEQRQKRVEERRLAEEKRMFDEANKNAEEKRMVDEGNKKKVGIPTIEDQWISVPWNVTLRAELPDKTITRSLHFLEWCPFLDLTCGSGKYQKPSDCGIDDDIEPPQEDVEDAIIAALVGSQKVSLQADKHEAFISK
ncbi:hypothetical protein BGW36DRAFT_378194 [Talaromyces proteolyticus]|uniref:Zn(2)-C6 fungal-type domain-containing protein n=1 Tax=Talaromyces proteolyticus TaxID=1131652 RepID=A0AAD4Q021_9EURO|nr:uncharacterized protein BGW36DRAFT_378194 [Talaromyces proteolyticus]KAH8697202.1 hypothetical protein BGW36DRAFT_378194 [Talaromyces proteolyticus]